MEKQVKKSKHDEYAEQVIGKWIWNYSFGPDFAIERRGEIAEPKKVIKIANGYRISSHSVNIEVAFDHQDAPRGSYGRSQNGIEDFHASREECLDDMMAYLKKKASDLEDKLANTKKAIAVAEGFR